MTYCLNRFHALLTNILCPTSYRHSSYKYRIIFFTQIFYVPLPANSVCPSSLRHFMPYFLKTFMPFFLQTFYALLPTDIYALLPTNTVCPFSPRLFLPADNLHVILPTEILHALFPTYPKPVTFIENVQHKQSLLNAKKIRLIKFSSFIKLRDQRKGKIRSKHVNVIVKILKLKIYRYLRILKAKLSIKRENVYVIKNRSVYWYVTLNIVTLCIPAFP